MIKLYDISEFDKVVNWTKFQTIAVIGRGTGANKYIYNQKKVFVLAINDSVKFYPQSKWSCVIEAHFHKIFQEVNGIVENMVLLPKLKIRNSGLVYGCTPSLFISYLIRNIPLKTIYLQGFSMDGVSPPGDPNPYDWNRQRGSFVECFTRAKHVGIDMKFVTTNPRMPDFPHGDPIKDHIL